MCVLVVEDACLPLAIAIYVGPEHVTASGIPSPFYLMKCRHKLMVLFYDNYCRDLGGRRYIEDA